MRNELRPLHWTPQGKKIPAEDASKRMIRTSRDHAEVVQLSIADRC